MTDSEREELLFDIANQELKGRPQSFIHSLAVDRMADLLSGTPDDQLLAIAAKAKKKTKTKGKATGF